MRRRKNAEELFAATTSSLQLDRFNLITSTSLQLRSL